MEFLPIDTKNKLPTSALSQCVAVCKHRRNECDAALQAQQILIKNHATCDFISCHLCHLTFKATL